jgi:hypothetical protein
MGLLFFFTETKQNILFGFCEKNTAWEKWVWVCCVWVVVYGFVVFSFWEKYRGLGLLCMGLLCLVFGKNTRVWVLCVWVA